MAAFFQVDAFSVPTGAVGRLPDGWRDSLDPAEQLWVATLFDGRGRLRDGLGLWHHPPRPGVPPPGCCSQCSQYFCRRLLLWMPGRMWQVELRAASLAAPRAGIYVFCCRTWV